MSRIGPAGPRGPSHIPPSFSSFLKKITSFVRSILLRLGQVLGACKQPQNGDRYAEDLQQRQRLHKFQQVSPRPTTKNVEATPATGLKPSYDLTRISGDVNNKFSYGIAKTPAVGTYTTETSGTFFSKTKTSQAQFLSYQASIGDIAVFFEEGENEEISTLPSLIDASYSRGAQEALEAKKASLTGRVQEAVSNYVSFIPSISLSAKEQKELLVGAIDNAIRSLNQQSPLALIVQLDEENALIYKQGNFKVLVLSDESFEVSDKKINEVAIKKSIFIGSSGFWTQATPQDIVAHKDKNAPQLLNAAIILEDPARVAPGSKKPVSDMACVTYYPRLHA